MVVHSNFFNPIALRTAKTPQSVGHSECNRVNKAIVTGYETVTVTLPQCVLCCAYLCIVSVV